MADLQAVALELLGDARAGRIGSKASLELADRHPSELAAALADDPSRIAFWLNVYNATVRAGVLNNPEGYGHRWRFFSSGVVKIAGRRLSLNAIEHGILRRSAWLIGFGHLRNPVPSSFERLMRVSRVDPRIHFALSCGARSCPPLRAWSPATLEVDLERATAGYLASTTLRRDGGLEIVVPRLLLWYRGDFGGSAGTLRLLRRHGLIAANERPRLRFGAYDWTLSVSEATAADPVAGGPRGFADESRRT